MVGACVVAASVVVGGRVGASVVVVVEASVVVGGRVGASDVVVVYS